MKLLIADDEAGVRSLVRMTLDSEDYEIIEAANGHDALAAAREHRPDLVLLDVNMPGPSGFDVCRMLKQDPQTADMTIVMLTAQAQESDLEAGLSSGADGYFTKPFSPIALLRKVEDVLAGKEEE
ncbi:MAG: response regulator [Actinomycetota bacterium]|nr:response regulator [Actinomycetota bacterium]